MSNFPSGSPTPDTFFQGQSSEKSNRHQQKTDRKVDFTASNRAQLNDQSTDFAESWTSRIPFQKIEFQRPKAQVFGRIYPINSPRKMPPPPRQKHVLNEKQKQAVIYFWGWQIRLQEDFTEAELKKAFRSLAHRLHPDKNNGKTKAFIEMKAHYQCLLSIFMSAHSASPSAS